jgi:hypothetical protein
MSDLEICFPRYNTFGELQAVNSAGVVAIDVGVLLDRLQRDEEALHQINGKDVILFLGKTKAGKTTTICSLADQKIVIRPEGLGDDDLSIEVVDTFDPFEGFRIGHSSDSTTNKINCCLLPRTSIVIADSCGFGDTSGCRVDIGNAVSLRNAVNVSSSLRIVICINVQMLGVDGGVPFTDLLRLLIQFFSPLEEVLPCMTFLFTHGHPQQTAKEILQHLSKLSSAEYVKANPPLLTFINHLFRFMLKKRICAV